MSVPTPHRPRRRRGRVAAAIGLTLLLLVGIGGAFLYAAYNHLNSNITALDISDAVGTAGPTSAAAPVVDNQAMNILLIGSDTRADQGKGYGNFGGARSDTTMLLHVPANRKYAVAVSFPRDLWVDIPSCKRDGLSDTAPTTTKFNAAFAYAGPACTIKTINELTGLNIDHFAIVDFSGFKNVINALGGVDVCLKEAVEDSKSGLDLPAGHTIVKGEQALAFVRARHSLGDGSDLARIQRQQEFLSSAYRKVSSSDLLRNPIKLFKVADAATKSLTTDPGLASLTKLKALGSSMSGIEPKDIRFVTVPYAPRGDGANVVMVDAKAQPIFDALRNDEVWPTPAPPATIFQGEKLTVQPENVRLAVLNGTATVGVAKEAAPLFTEQGFNVVQVANAKKKTFVATTITYDPNYLEAARTVAASIPGSVMKAKDSIGRTITVTIGTDFQGVVPVVVPKAKKTNDEGRTAADAVCAS